MAQLHATVNEIQLTTNMITAGDKLALTAWTDEKYPSAKAVADQINNLAPGRAEHPIGSILITSTNVSPETSVGGTWDLVDKGFKNTSANISSLWTSSRATASGYISWADHSICLKMWLKTDDHPLSPSSGIGSIDRAKSGITTFSLSDEGGVAFAVTGTTSTTNYVIKYKLDGGGFLSLEEIYGETVAAFSGATIHIHTIIPISYTDMLDDFCDKFYWKRTA
jgi:hypothetical protein